MLSVWSQTMRGETFRTSAGIRHGCSKHVFTALTDRYTIPTELWKQSTVQVGALFRGRR